ncbi:hypothetical protein C8E87_6850 [Paractinoplanes brasiliensis]|uniref:Uncharacterized protein n=1 Tax=Paractinoplanes brasiliensis TaxID=52695 RepID=A0A4R6JAE4_9ACTN|nr:hypothetical protein C8E87_6850 [Actinoplanes brasiliensis]
MRCPDLTSAEENRARERALATARGWRAEGLFEGFPDRVDWFHGSLPPDALARVLFIDYSYWNELSGGSRRPADVRATLESGALPGWVTEIGTDWCFELAARLATTPTVDDLIVMATPSLDKMVLLEGHARLSAVFVGGHDRRLTVNAYVGLSPAVTQWPCF